MSPRANRMPWLALMAAWALISAVFWPTVAGMIEIWWRSGTFTHAFAVPPLVGWLIWRQRQAVQAAGLQPSRLALLGMFSAGLVWLLGELAFVNVLTQGAYVALLVMAVPAVMGWRAARVLTFPLAFAFFMVPFGEFLMPRMMDWTADFTVAALRLSGIPVYREGLNFVIPSGNWSVVEACSGIRYLIASFCVGSLYAYLSYRSAARRWAFVGVSLAVPIVANWLRAYLIVMLGHLSGNELATGADHLVYGWLFFGVVMALMFWIGGRWADAPVSPTSASHPAEEPSGGDLHAAAHTSPGSFAGAAAAALFAAALAPVAAAWLTRAPTTAEPDLTPPAQLAGAETATGAFIRTDTLPADWAPGYTGPNQQHHHGWRTGAVPDGGAPRLGIHLVYYRQQDRARKLISSETKLVRADNNLWKAVVSSPQTLEIAGGRSAHLLQTVLLGPDRGAGLARERLRIWQLVWVNGHWLPLGLKARLQLLKGQLAGRGDDAVALVVYQRDTVSSATDAARFAAEDERGLRTLTLAVLKQSETALTQSASQPR